MTIDFKNLSAAEWREKLTPEQYQVLRQAGTERAFTGKYDKNKAAGEYRLRRLRRAAVRHPTPSTTAARAGPASPRPSPATRSRNMRDAAHGMVRTEVRCATCEGHLGHVFPDGPGPEGLRYCINSAALDFKPKDEQRGE